MLYVINNQILRDFQGLWSTPVVSNYHPLTIFTLALNYQAAGLEPMSYYLTNIILHVVNVGLVFWLISLLTNRNFWISAFVALLFGIHPMHVESVAWISERKDVLYTIFYLLAMIGYVFYVQKREMKYLISVTVLGALSLLSKPAAIVLPMSLMALDYFLKRKWSWQWIVEKIPLFVLSAVFAYLTMDIQSNRAVASLELHSFMDRISFAGFGTIWYLLKVFVPYPLSALHPFPEELNVFYYLAPVIALAGVAYLWWKKRQDRLYFFVFSFYLINLILVLQLISIGNAVVAERYTYVPYISIFFLLGVEGYRLIEKRPKWRNLVFGVAGVWMGVLAAMTFLHLPNWKNSQALWENVLHHYPDAKRAWTNKGLDHFEQKEWDLTIEHLTKALELDPVYFDALEWRARAYLEKKENKKALADAQTLYRYYPSKEQAKLLLARSLEYTGEPAAAVDMYTQLINEYPQKAEYYNNRGVAYFNKLQRYEQAKPDFEKAIQLKPNEGSYLMNLSRCQYMMGDQQGAVASARKALELGAARDDGFLQLIGL